MSINMGGWGVIKSRVRLLGRAQRFARVIHIRFNGQLRMSHNCRKEHFEHQEQQLDNIYDELKL